MTAATLPRHRHRRPLAAELARDIWRALTRRRRTGRRLDAVLEAAAAPVHGPETLAQAAERERAFSGPIHHAPPPLLARQLELAALTGLAEPATGPIHPTAWQAVQPQDGPVPDAMQDDDPRYPDLARPDWEFQTGQWPAFMDSFEFEGEQDASPAT